MKTQNPLPKNVPRGDGTWTFSRRHCIDQLTPVEKTVFNAIGEVENLGADPLLTDAVVLLGQVRDKLADWLEGGTR